MSSRTPWRALLLLAAGLLLATAPTALRAETPPSATPEEELLLDDEEDDWLFEEESGEADPLESSNRVVFEANERIYRWLLDPIANGYEWVVPGVARRSVRRFFANLGMPAVLVNDIFQLRGRRAGLTSTRFLINSTLGIGGLLDPATAWGIEGHQADFGETLGIYGVAAGPYVVLPIFGPTSARDAFGGVVDGLLRPDYWLLGSGPLAMVFTGDGLSTYDSERRQLDELRRSSLDFYAALRSAYRMDREARIRRSREQRCPQQAELDAIPPPAAVLR